MSLSLRVLSRGRSRSARGVELDVACPHCGTTAAPWSADVGSIEDPVFLCIGCGNLSNGDGVPYHVCTTCADLVPDGQAHVKCLPSGLLPAEHALADRAGSALSAEYGLRDASSVVRYVATVAAPFHGDEPLSVAVVDRDEPAIAGLPGHSLAITAGMLRVLEDEAQLAFLLAREASSMREGWPTRRFAAAAHPKRGLFSRLGRERDARLARAVDLSLWVGYGAEAERRADAEALSALVRAEYDVASATRALRRVEAASLATRGARFLLSAERTTWLEEGIVALGPTTTARLNREVFRRACGQG